MRVVEEFREPSRFGVPPMGYFYPILGSANGREDRIVRIVSRGCHVVAC